MAVNSRTNAIRRTGYTIRTRSSILSSKILWVMVLLRRTKIQITAQYYEAQTNTEAVSSKRYQYCERDLETAYGRGGLSADVQITLRHCHFRGNVEVYRPLLKGQVRFLQRVEYGRVSYARRREISTGNRTLQLRSLSKASMTDHKQKHSQITSSRHQGKYTIHESSTL